MDTSTPVDIYTSDDYAGLEVGCLRFYYGYEITTTPEDEDDPGEWCFQCTDSGHVVCTFPRSALVPAPDDGTPYSGVLAGIGMMIQRGDIAIN